MQLILLRHFSSSSWASSCHLAGGLTSVCHAITVPFGYLNCRKRNPSTSLAVSVRHRKAGGSFDPLASLQSTPVCFDVQALYPANQNMEGKYLRWLVWAYWYDHDSSQRHNSALHHDQSKKTTLCSVGVAGLFYSLMAYNLLNDDKYFNIVTFIIFFSIIVHGTGHFSSMN